MFFSINLEKLTLLLTGGGRERKPSWGGGVLGS